MKNIAVLQPLIPHYRQEFFKGLLEHFSCDIYCYSVDAFGSKQNFKNSDIPYKNISSHEFKGFLWYSPFSFLNSKYTILVLMLNFGHLTTWLLLATKFIHRKKIILWGHGISVKRYHTEENKPDFLLRLMIYMADGVWFYTEREKKLWETLFPKKHLISLSNTISEIDSITNRPAPDIELLREKHSIKQDRILIFCARFNNPNRRTDLLIDLIKSVDSTKFGFIIIGDGNLKPSFKPFDNVYDFGEVYDRNLKDELFQISNIYFQPAWVGLSIVEAMAYGKPIFTFPRSKTLLQCVEYSYIEDGYNGMIMENIDSLILQLNLLSDFEIRSMGMNSVEYVKKNLTINKMITSAVDSIKTL